MIGVTSFARFAGLVGWPAVLPRFAKAAWLGILPEFNPFKYNSFPVNGARQSSPADAGRCRAEIARHERGGQARPSCRRSSPSSRSSTSPSARGPSSTRSTPTCPPNGSELVLFDLNRAARFGPLLRRARCETVLDAHAPAPPRSYRTTIITNGGAEPSEVGARHRGRRDRRATVRRSGSLPARRVLAFARRPAVPARATRSTACTPTARGLRRSRSAPSRRAASAAPSS